MDREQAKKFSQRWKGRGDEKSDCQTFWLDFLQNVCGVEDVAEFIFFEERVKLQHKSFIDATIPSTHVMIEQKSLDKDLSRPIKQSDGTFLTPYQQAKRYANELPYSKRPRWIVACNFAEFRVYDMENPQAAPEIIFLEDLPQELYRLKFLVDADNQAVSREVEVSLQAGEIVQKLYATLRKNYLNPDDAKSLQSLNKLCVRLVFCLYAESTGVLGDKNIFRNYLNQFKPEHLRKNLIELFKVLDTPIADRDPYLSDDLKIFPYVNGNLFSEAIEIPNFNDEIKFFLLEYASRNFDWSEISPTIFGAVFESTLNPVTRREGGMHYTSIENIHRAIDTLFLDDLRKEFLACKKNRRKLLALQDKIAALKFFDPACGSGNFLTESYISLRRLENDILKELLGSQITIGELDNPVKVSINQFYGVEINDFAVSVAQTALWISELQMLDETAEIIHRDLNPLPLKSYANIFEGNALKIDWWSIFKIKNEELKIENDNADNSIINSQLSIPNYIFGNPPFVGHQWRTPAQVEDMKIAFHDYDKHGKLDYVCAWYNKTADFIKGTRIEAAFVSTNSICQGESVKTMWKFFFAKGMQINFTYRAFRWDSESTDKAHVHCVVIGFANFARPQKIIFDGDKKIFAKNINGYLLDAPNIFIENRGNPPKDFPKMTKGSQPTDGGNLILSEDEKISLLKKFPHAEKFVREFIGAEEFLHNKKRYCLWLVDAQPSDIKKIPPIYDRIKKVADFRKTSKRKQTLKAADIPQLFSEIRQPTKKFLAVPKVSSEKRKYIPMAFMNPEIIVADSLQTISEADLFLFGILTSNVHMIWTNFACGRLEMRINYSAKIVYNNFIFPERDEKIVATAQKILDVRAKYAESSLADLYDAVLMPKDLRDAHKKNDLAVMSAYGFPADWQDEEILSELMKKYAALTGQNFDDC